MPPRLSGFHSMVPPAREGFLAKRSRIVTELDRAGYRVPGMSLTVHHLSGLSPVKYEQFLGFLTRIRAEVRTSQKLLLYVPRLERLNSMDVDFLLENTQKICENFYFANKRTFDLSRLHALYYGLRDFTLLRELRGGKADRTPLPVGRAEQADATPPETQLLRGSEPTPVSTPVVAPAAVLSVLRETASGPQLLAEVTRFTEAEENYYEDLKGNPEASIDKIFRSLDHDAGRLRALGFMNVAVYRPKNDGSGEWALTHATREYGESAFSRGSVPDAATSTVGWIIQHGGGKSVRVDDVDIYDPATFAARGIPYHPERAETDRQMTIGSGRTLFIRVASSKGVEAVVQLHNRVLRKPGKAEPPPPLPADASEAAEVKAMLKSHFRGNVLPAIEAIRGREITNEQAWQSLTRHYPVRKMKFVDRLSGEKIPLQIMDMRNIAALQDQRIVDTLTQVFRKISCDAWEGTIGRKVAGYSEQYIRDHFFAERTLLVRDPANGEFVAFCGVNHISQPDGLSICVLEVGMVEPRYQNMRIVTKLMRDILFDHYLANGLGQMVVATRTANPQVMGSLQPLVEIFPDARNPQAEPSDWQKAAFKLVRHHLNPGYQANERTFVVEDVYPMESGLVMPVHRIPLYNRDARVNTLCFRQLDYEHHNRPEFFDQELERIAAAQWGELAHSLPETNEGASRTEALNRLVADPTLAQKMARAHLKIKANEYLKYLLLLTRSDRGKNFETLEINSREAIKYLNRMLLEEAFDFLPKRRSKAQIIVGKVTAGAKRAYKVKEWRRWFSDLFVSVLRWVIK